MKKYKYVAVNLQKKKFSGTFLAESEDQLRSMLVQQNLYLVSAKPVNQDTPSTFLTLSGKVKLSELTGFCRQFAIMINSGISILESLGILAEQSYSALFCKVLGMIYEDVKVGTLLSDAMKKHKKIFPQFFQSMIYVGEVSGKLDGVLNSLADYYEKDAKMKRKVKSVLTYPIILLIMLVGIVSLMMFFIIPTFRESLSSLEMELPAITLAIYAMSDFFLANGLNLFGGIFIGIVLLFLLGKHPKVRYYLDMLLLRLPLIRQVQSNTLTSKFARGFGLLVESGLDLIESLDVICNVLGNKYLQKNFRAAIEDIRQGMTMTMAFETYHLFPPILLQMLSIGEKSDTIAEVLQRSCSFFDEQVETSLSALTAVIQPVMLVLLGGTIGVMFIAIYSPMLGIMNSLGS